MNITNKRRSALIAQGRRRTSVFTYYHQLAIVWLLLFAQIADLVTSQSYIINEYAGTGLTSKFVSFLIPFVSFVNASIVAPFVNGPATAATFNYPRQATVDTLGNLYVADTLNCVVRKIDTSGIVSTIGGMEGVSSSIRTVANNGDAGPATSTNLYSPVGVCVSDSQLYVVDGSNVWVRIIALNSGIISTLAGSGYTGDIDGTGTNAYFTNPFSCAMSSGITSVALLIVDYTVGKLKKIDLGTRLVTTIGTSIPSITSIWMDSNAILYAGTNTNVIYSRSYTDSGAFTLIAGVTSSSAKVDSIGTSARFGAIYGMTGDSMGNLFIADYTNRVVRKMATATYAVTTIAGNGASSGTAGNGGPALLGSLMFPFGICVTTVGDIYVTDYGANNIR